MYLKCHRRFKDGKEHRYWSIVEKRRLSDDRTVDRHVLYLGEINDSQKESWLRCIKVFDADTQVQKRLALFPADQPIPEHAAQYGVGVRLSEFVLRHPRQWGACWAFCKVWGEMKLDEFWQERLGNSREGTSWYHVLMVLVAYRLMDPGSEWRCHRQWYENSAMGDLLGEDFGVAAKDTLYRCLDKLAQHKDALFGFLVDRWRDLFGATYDVLLYDLTSTYFESNPPFGKDDKRRYGHSRDHRPDCVQVVIALIVTPEGFPLTYEVLPGNTKDSSTLEHFLQKIHRLYGKARRIWIMDRGIPTEEHLAKMRQEGVSYLVGTPKGRLSKLEQALLKCPWVQARPSVQVKLLPQDKELYVWIQSHDRVNKERAMRRRKLKKLWKRLKQLQKQRPVYKTLLLKLGAAKKDAGRVWGLIRMELPEPSTKDACKGRISFSFGLNKKKLRIVRRREGRYLLRSNLTQTDPAKLWELYLQLTEIEAAFKNLKGDLVLRPIFHQKERRIEAHIFVAFLAYCVHVSLKEKLKRRAPGLTVRQLLEKLATIQMLDVHFPTTDNRELIFTRYTQPEKDHQLLLAQLNWTLPAQAPPKITAKRNLEM